MLLGYNTNGLAHHSLATALELIAENGYRCAAITIDHGSLNPYAADFERQVEQTAILLRDLNLESVIETGTRFLLNSRVKHDPTLVSAREAGRPLRVEFLRHAIDLAVALKSRCVSLWSGRLPPGDSRTVGYQRLVESLSVVLDYAGRYGMRLGFEPEPGMLVDSMHEYAHLLSQIDSPFLQLTLDVGHLECNGETPIPAIIERWSDRLVNVHIEDMRRGVHEHLMFGEGDIDFPPIIRALQHAGYRGPLCVELSRHSHMGPEALKRAYEFLTPILEQCQARG